MVQSVRAQDFPGRRERRAINVAVVRHGQKTGMLLDFYLVQEILG